ncbi:MAG: hypothetical protein ACLSE4_09005 [Clostridium sp.]
MGLMGFLRRLKRRNERWVMRGKELLAQKKAQLKAKQQRAEIQQYKDRLTKSIEDFSQKYRYADEAEEVKLGKFISKLDFAQPGQLSIQEVCPYPHENVYLCF